jgi:hypothetical protein
MLQVRALILNPFSPHADLVSHSQQLIVSVGQHVAHEHPTERSIHVIHVHHYFNLGKRRILNRGNRRILLFVFAMSLLLSGLIVAGISNAPFLQPWESSRHWHGEYRRLQRDVLPLHSYGGLCSYSFVGDPFLLNVGAGLILLQQLAFQCDATSKQEDVELLPVA